MKHRILYEDNHIIAVNKLSGELSQGDATGDPTLADDVKRYIKECYSKPGNVFLGIAHRIDRPVSGVILFARTSKALERLTALIRERKLDKTYWAIVGKKPKELQGDLLHFIERDHQKNISHITIEGSGNGKESRLSYQVIKSINNFHLLEINLHTGRHHQIRAQLSAIGSPIVGDVKYGYHTALADASIALHARKLEFIHPVRKDQVTIIAPVPGNAIWNHFK